MPRALTSALCAALIFFNAAAQAEAEGFGLQACIATALQKNRRMELSGAALAMAEAQYQQAMSAFYPSLDIEVNAQRADQDRTFTANTTINLPPTVSGPLSAAAGQPVTALPLDLNVKLFDRDILTGSINLTYPIFTGGRRSAMIGQAEKNLQIAEVGRQKSQLEIIRDVKKYYYGARFALEMEKLAADTLARFEVLEELTERLFQHGSLKVKKTDYLRTKTATALTRSMLTEASYAREMAHEALNNVMGYDWSHQVRIEHDQEEFKLNSELAQLIHSAQTFNPDVQQLRLAVSASDDKISEARSGYFPAIGFKASAYRVWNEFDSGLVNDDNREGWTIGIGLQWNLFDGFRTSGKVSEAKALQRQLENKQILLDQATALQIKQQFLKLRSFDRQVEDNRAAHRYARENRELHIRAYQEELVETEDVIQAQIVESFAHSAYFRAKNQLALALSALEYLVGGRIPELKH